jgi:AcrR family transcriptional regulator
MNLDAAKGADVTAKVAKGHRREANKVRRVHALLNAARELIRLEGNTDFTMQQLAEQAGHSLATTYNVIGTKAAVLYALLDRSLVKLGDAQAKVSEREPIVRSQIMVRMAVRFFTADGPYFRALMRYLLGVYEPQKRPLFMSQALSFWQIALMSKGAGPESGPAVTLRADVACGLHLAFTGALDLWVHGEITDTEFEAMMLRQAELLLGATA